MLSPGKYKVLHFSISNIAQIFTVYNAVDVTFPNEVVS
jgi:hypothetical protein